MKAFIAIASIFAGTACVFVAGPSYVSTFGFFSSTSFSTTDLSSGTIIKYVRATGTVEPVQAVEVGSFLSGPIIMVDADFNDTVKEGQVIAKIDPRLFEADVARDRAALAIAKAEVAKVQANLQLAINNEKRGLAAAKKGDGFVSQENLDQLKFSKEALQADLELANANVKQAEGLLNNSETNLKYTDIRSPVDGVVIDRMVEPGQTVAAAFKAPELFVVAPDLSNEMHVFAKIDEADIGLVIAAQKSNRPVHFTVDAHPDEVFEGKIKQVRSRSSTIDNVVTFPVIITTTNPDLKLLPGMTANLYIEAEVAEDAVRVPNAAILFRPPANYVREEDRRLLEPDFNGDATEKVGTEMLEGRDRRHVWVRDGELLRAVEITVGINDEKFTEVISDELVEGEEVVVGIES